MKISIRAGLELERKWDLTIQRYYSEANINKQNIINILKL